MEVGCKLGPIDGSLLLINYEHGYVGFRLSLLNKTQTPIVLESFSPLMTNRRNGSVNLTAHPAEWRVYVDSGECGRKCASYGINENEGHNVAGAVSVLWSPEGNQSLAIGQVEVERSWTEIVYDFGKKGINHRKYHWAQANNLRLRLEQDASGYRLDSGETFDRDHCLLIFDPDPFRALTSFTDAMVAFNHVRKLTNDDVWVGWMTWYNQEHHLRGAFGATG
jgi:hypothetical protein